VRSSGVWKSACGCGVDGSIGSIVLGAFVIDRFSGGWLIGRASWSLSWPSVQQPSEDLGYSTTDFFAVVPYSLGSPSSRFLVLPSRHFVWEATR